MTAYSDAVTASSHWWRTQGKNTHDKITKTESEVAVLAKSADELYFREAGYNPIKFIKNAWERATVLPGIQEKRSSLQNDIDSNAGELRLTSESQAAQILLARSKEDPDVASVLNDIVARRKPLHETRTTLSEISAKTKQVLDVIKTAWDEADDASSWETIDMFGSNAGITLVSHLETSEAKEHLDLVRETLIGYKDFMQKSSEKLSSLQLTGLRADGIATMAEWDLWMGVFDLDIISFFTSWENQEQLEKAKTKLESLGSAIEPILQKTETALSDNGKAVAGLDAEYLSLRTDVARASGLPDLFYKYLPMSEPPRYAPAGPEPQQG